MYSSPQAPTGQDYERGADAYDEAARLAREHHERTGNTSFVRVQTFEASVEAARFG